MWLWIIGVSLAVIGIAIGIAVTSWALGGALKEIFRGRW